MSVKRTNETTFKDNKNAKENLLKFSTAVAAIAATFPQGLHKASNGRTESERARARTATHVSDFETEMEMEKETEILNTKRQGNREKISRKTIATQLLSSFNVELVEMAGMFNLNRESVAAAEGEGTNHQHLQEQFNKSNYSTSSSLAVLASAVLASSRAQNKVQKPIEMLEIKQQQQQQQTPNDLSSSKKTQTPTKQAKDLKASSPQHNVIDASTAPPICLHIHICDSPSASLFQRSPLFWRCCCLCPNTMKLCSPVLRDLIFLLCFIFIVLFLILSATFSDSYLRHYNATLCKDCTF